VNAMKSHILRRIAQGFTLIEVLVVLVIVFLLAAFVLPSLMQAKHKAQRISCVSRLT